MAGLIAICVRGGVEVEQAANLNCLFKSLLFCAQATFMLGSGFCAGIGFLGGTIIVPNHWLCRRRVY